MKVILLNEHTMTKQIYLDLYGPELSGKFDVESWSIPKVIGYNYELVDGLEKRLEINSKEEFIKCIKNLPNDTLIITPFLSRNTQKILKQYSPTCKLLLLQKGFVTSSVYRKFNYMNLNLKFIIKDLIFTLKRLLIRPYNYIFLSGYSKIEYPREKYIYGHSTKYDEYLNVKNELRLIEEKYILFLDTDLAYHHDMIKDSSKENIEPSVYFKKMNELFKRLEKKQNMKVIISAHPKANYEGHEFEGRKIIKYKTNNLIHNSEFVVAHVGTSLANAILSEKGIIFVYYNEMLEKATKGWAKTCIAHSKILGSPLLNLDKEYSVTKPKINKKLYEKFKKEFLINYLKTDKLNSQILIEFIDKFIRK